jgi:hypothetical protein
MGAESFRWRKLDCNQLNGNAGRVFGGGDYSLSDIVLRLW